MAVTRPSHDGIPRTGGPSERNEMAILLIENEDGPTTVVPRRLGAARAHPAGGAEHRVVEP